MDSAFDLILFSVSDRTEVMAVITPCQLYYSHPHFVNMPTCSGDVPDYWNSYELLKELDYDRFLIHLTSGAKLELALEFLEKTLLLSTSPAVEYPFDEILISSATTLTNANELDIGEGDSELKPLHDSSYVDEWLPEKKKRAADHNITTSVHITLVSPRPTKPHPPIEFLPEPLPRMPEEKHILLLPVIVEDPYDTKYCTVVTLFYLIVLVTFCVLLSIIAKYYVERENFKIS